MMELVLVAALAHVDKVQWWEFISGDMAFVCAVPSEPGLRISGNSVDAICQGATVVLACYDALDVSFDKYTVVCKDNRLQRFLLPSEFVFRGGFE